jgi:hypothetical protein
VESRYFFHYYRISGDMLLFDVMYLYNISTVAQPCTVHPTPRVPSLRAAWSRDFRCFSVRTSACNFGRSWNLWRSRLASKTNSGWN